MSIISPNKPENFEEQNKILLLVSLHLVPNTL